MSNKNNAQMLQDTAKNAKAKKDAQDAKDAKSLILGLFGGRITRDLKAGNDIENYRNMGFDDDDIVEKMLQGIDVNVAMIDLGYEKNCQPLIDAAKKSLKKEISILSSLAFEHIMENNYLTNQALLK